MKNKKFFITAVVLFVLFVIPQIASAVGSLDSYGTGLWDYYVGKKMSWVKSHAPMFKKLTDTRYLLDEAEINDLELYLLGEFNDDRLVLLHIMAPFPDYSSCTDEINDLAIKFGIIGSVFMGIDFDVENECGTQEGMIMCVQDRYLCLFELCPDELADYACSSTELLSQ